MHKPDSIPDNETHKILRNFERQTNYIIPARRPDLVILKSLLYSGFGNAGGPQSKCQTKRKAKQVLGLRQKTKKAVEHESNSDNNCNWRAWMGPQKLSKRAGKVGNQRMNRDHPNDSIV